MAGYLEQGSPLQAGAEGSPGSARARGGGGSNTYGLGSGAYVDEIVEASRKALSIF